VKLEGRNLQDVLNMDQIPIQFSYHSNKMLARKGSNTIHTRASTTDRKHVTLGVTVSTSGKMLTPFIIFKGKPNGCIALQEFGTYPDAGKYACQEKAWIDEFKMNDWIDVVLWPWTEHQDANNPFVEPPIIIFHVNCVDQMGSVVICIQSMGLR
jgi:hypothetical protein